MDTKTLKAMDDLLERGIITLEKWEQITKQKKQTNSSIPQIPVSTELRDLTEDAKRELERLAIKKKKDQESIDELIANNKKIERKARDAGIRISSGDEEQDDEPINEGVKPIKGGTKDHAAVNDSLSILRKFGYNV